MTEIQTAMRIIEDFGGIDGEHHKAWVIDQVARALLCLATEGEAGE